MHDMRQFYKSKTNTLVTKMKCSLRHGGILFFSFFFTPASIPHLNSLHALHKEVVASEDELRGELPLPDGLPFLEVGLQLLPVVLVQLGEGVQDLRGLAHFVNRLLHLPFEQLVRRQKVAGLEGT